MQDATGRIQAWNDRALEMMAMTSAQMNGAEAATRNRVLYHADGSVMAPADIPIARTARTGEPCRDVVVGVSIPDGDTVWICVNTRALREGDRITGAVATMSDITERRRVEEARRVSEERFRAVSDVVGSVIFDHDLVTDTLYRSDALRSVFLWEDAQPTRAWWNERVHPDDAEHVSAVFDAAMRDPSASQLWTAEYRFRRGDGLYVTVSERGAILRAPDGAALRCIGTMIDVSAREELSAQLRQAQKMEAVGQLAGGIAHDFNNLLTAISCNVELLLDEIPVTDAHRDDVVQIREAAARAAALTRQLLAFSRRQVLQPTSLDLNATVGNMDRLLRRVLSADVQLHTALHAAVPPVYADAGQMEQVLMNLVLNARDAMHAGGTILVGTAPLQLDAPLAHRFGVVPAGEYVALSVKDAGSGIHSDVLGRLFEPFFTTKAHGKGTGLGLATVHGIVAQSSGHIVVDTTVGKGTTFTVYLPVARSRTTPPASVPVAPALVPALVSAVRESATSSSRTVLVVDDEPAVRDVTMRAIVRAGYRVIGASRGADALTLLAREPERMPILLLTDIMMPEMNGHELATAVEQRYPYVHIACMSGFSSEEIARHGLAAHARRLLHKPFTLPDLVAFIDDAFSTSAAAA